ncbi:hypothetical protein CK203_095064 [Vitis vinifera]|uniref:Nuclease associated modular domain-containing protein n=1 Tax=Vitis vinifera TaxID=29760 RepID=A0A438EWQ7_VITVI|nr:hypothetical protein CK203_095064 [Vitis vinifera]
METLPDPQKVDFNVGHLEARWGKFLIKAVATLEAKCSVQGEDGQKGYNNLPLGVDSRPPGNPIQSSSEEYSELDERERLRRMRISKANKGNTPWNKGKKHSAETLQRIRERTKLAMQDPKVKMKLVNLGHAQSGLPYKAMKEDVNQLNCLCCDFESSIHSHQVKALKPFQEDLVVGGLPHLGLLGNHQNGSFCCYGHPPELLASMPRLWSLSIGWSRTPPFFSFTCDITTWVPDCGT